MEEKMKKDRFTEGVFDSYPDVVSVEEIQQMLRIGKNAVYTLLKDGEWLLQEASNRRTASGTPF